MKKTLILLAVVPVLGLTACQKKQEPPPAPAAPAPMAAAPGQPPEGMPAMPPSHGAMPGQPPQGMPAMPPQGMPGQAPQGMPGQPGMGQQTVAPVPKQVQVPDEVQKTWKGVVLQVVDKATKKSQDVKVDIGKTAKVGDLEITVEHFLPDFTMSGAAITSKSNKTQNPAAKLVVKEKGNQVYTGWRFSLFPQAHPMNLEKYEIQLKDFVKKG